MKQRGIYPLIFVITGINSAFWEIRLLIIFKTRKVTAKANEPVIRDIIS